MRYLKPYLLSAGSLTILSLMAQSVPARAGPPQIAISSERVTTTDATSTTPSVTTTEVSDITAPVATFADINQMAQSPAITPPQEQTALKTVSKTHVTSVSQLSGVQPTDWAFQVLQALIKRYGCLVGYPDGSFDGNRALSRYEFAAGLNACLNSLAEEVEMLPPEDLTTLRQLQAEFASELANLQGRVDDLEARTTELEANQFSTTTKLIGRAYFAVNGGGFSGERIIAPTGAEISNTEPNTTFIHLASLTLDTSFSGTDQLRIRLVAGSEGTRDNVAGLLEPNFGSVLAFAIPGTSQLELNRLFYTFTPSKDLTLTLGPAILAVDYVDKNSYTDISQLNFSTRALIANFILFPRPAGAGAVIDWNPGEGPLTVRAVYVAGAGATAENQGFLGSTPNPTLLFPTRGGEGGLFGDPYQGIVELEYSSSDFALRLQYSGGSVFGSRFNVFGANFELHLSKSLGIFGRYGYGSYDNESLFDTNPMYWMAGIGFRDLFVPGALAGIAAGQPAVESNIGNATQTNIEAFYNFPVSDNIRVTPLVQLILDPGNQSSNGTIYTGTLRTVFSF